MEYKIKNPLLAGFYPDPSIIRVEDDFYMVTSSFSFFPAVPVFHSKDLANWRQIGHVLTRPEQINLDAQHISGGIFAPTLRYNNGIFYMITTNVSDKGNFIVTAKDPAGPWSNPHWIENAEGIDPSLFWDDDGTAYYTGTSSGTQARESYVWGCKIDLENFCLVGEKKKLWSGALKDAWCPEAPHIYKKDGFYYLLIAEGGTEFYHAVTIARSKQVMGEYEGCDANPVFTHRHLGSKAEIVNTGHADLVELRDGSWYMVLLASRPYGGYHKNLGRETFIAPVVWEHGWPVVCPGKGVLEWEYPAANLPHCPVETTPHTDDFSGTELDYCWNFLGVPAEDTAFIKNNRLHIHAAKSALKAEDEVLVNEEKHAKGLTGFVARRQQHKSFTVQTEMLFEAKNEEAAGLIILQNDFHSLRLQLINKNGKAFLQAVKGYRSLESELCFKLNTESYKTELCGEMELEAGSCTMLIEAREQNISFYALVGGQKLPVAQNVHGGFLGSETAGGFVGAYVGMFATANGNKSDNYAQFNYFTYLPMS